MDAAAEIAALERQILADPDADAPRRRIGELWTAQGDPRGRLMELQLAAAANHRKGELAGKRVRAELKELIAQHGARWAKPVAGMVDDWELRRGFVEHVTLPARDFLVKAETLFAAAPIRHLTVTDARPVLAMLLASPHLDRMRSLGLAGNGLDDQAIAALARSPHVRDLRWLDLSKNKITRAGLDELATSTELARLRFLLILHNPCTDPTPRPPIKDGWADWPDPSIPELGRELIARHGRKPWLYDAPPDWPADRDYDPA